jgi:HK97 family phage prohead protease
MTTLAMMENKRVDLQEIKFSDDSSDLGTFSGYGSITGNVDAHGDVIEKGAFADTISEHSEKGTMPKMLLQHGLGFTTDDALPIGVWTSMVENSRGLKLSGKLFALDTDRGKYIHAGLKAGALDGLSIGFRIKDQTLGTKPSEPKRLIKSVDLVEVSVVTQPANPKARIGHAKSEDVTIREFERFLRDEGGFSRAAAESIALHGFKQFSVEPRDEEELKSALADSFGNLANIFKPEKEG